MCISIYKHDFKNKQTNNNNNNNKKTGIEKLDGRVDT